MASTQTFDPAKAGFRVADTPITRKPRRPSTRAVKRPQYADAVWFSFNQGHALEVTVPVRAVADTIRKLKTAARFLERTEQAEVRVQISVEEVDDEPGKARHSLVKFLGHEPWLLGRRVSKVEAEAREAGQQAAEDVIAARTDQPARPRHRRTTAGTRGSHARRTALRDPVVRAVITRSQPLRPVTCRMRGLRCFRPSFSATHTRFSMVIASGLPGRYHLLTPTEMLGG